MLSLVEAIVIVIIISELAVPLMILTYLRTGKRSH